MGIMNIFLKRMKNESTTYNLDAVEDFFLQSKDYLNPKDGPEFVAGIRSAYTPISTAVSQAVGRELEYGDTLRKFCEISPSDPEGQLKALIKLAASMKPAPASGVRFLIGQLILHYYSVGALREDPLIESSMRQMDLLEESVRILNAYSQYG